VGTFVGTFVGTPTRSTRLVALNITRREREMQYSDAGNGITADSLSFYETTRHHLGEIAEISIRFPGFTDPFDPYLMVLRDHESNEIRLSGCAAGYNGEGPRGSLRILRDVGVSDGDARRVLTDPHVMLRVPISAPAVDGAHRYDTPRSPDLATNNDRARVR
jgi:hypothetical protein